MLSIWMDLRYGARALRKQPAFSILAVLALGLGIGAATTIFSVIQNVLLDPFPYTDAERVVAIQIRDSSSSREGGRSGFQVPEFLDYKEQNHIFEDVIGGGFEDILYTTGEGTEQFNGGLVTGNMFGFLGVPATLGRTLTAEDARPGAPPVFVMSYKMWVKNFNLDPTILGRTMPSLRGKGARAAGSAQGPGWRRFVEPLRNRNLLGICLGFFCFDYYWYLLVTWLTDYLVTVRHLTILTAGLYSSLPFFVFGVSEPIGGWIADRLIRKGWDETRTRKGIVTFAFSTGLLVIPAALAARANTAILLIIGGSLVGLATGNLLVILQCCAPPDDVEMWTGFENFFGNIAGVLAPLLTGFLISRTRSYSPGFVLAALVLMTGLISYWFIVGQLKPVEER